MRIQRSGWREIEDNKEEEQQHLEPFDYDDAYLEDAKGDGVITLDEKDRKHASAKLVCHPFLCTDVQKLSTHHQLRRTPWPVCLTQR